MINKIKEQKELSLIVILALFLRIPLLNGSFWMDETAQALEVIRPLSQQFDIVADFQPPLLHLILHLAQYFSHAEWWLRAIGALIPGLITIFFTYKLAEKLFNKNTAVLSSLLLATSSFHIFYSQELRPYSLPTMFALISMYYFFQLLEKKPSKQHDKKINKIKTKLSIANLLGLYSSYLFPFLMIGQIIFVLTKDIAQLHNWNSKNTLSKKLRPTFSFLKTQIIPIAGFSLWLPMFFKQLEAGELVRKNLPGWETVVSIPQIKAIPLVIGKFIFGNLDIEPNQYFIIFGSLIIIPISTLLFISLKKIIVNEKTSIYKQFLNFFKKGSNTAKNSNLLFVLAWLIIPLLTSWLISFYVPVIRPKRLLYLLPAFYILISFLINKFLTKKQGELRSKRGCPGVHKLHFALAITLALSIFSVNLFSTLAYYTNPKLQRENWRDLYQNISENFSPSNTVMIYSFPDKFAPITWYENHPNNASNLSYPYIATGKLSIKDVDDLANTLKIVVEYDNVLVFDYLRDLSDPQREIEKELINFGLKEVDTIDYPNIGFMRVFSHPHSLIGVK